MASAKDGQSESHNSQLSRYLGEIRSFPILSADHEHLLAQRWVAERDQNAAATLVTSHLRLVLKIASGLRGYGQPLSDLVAQGNLGLMKALQKFDPDRGIRFSSYAMWWIRAEMLDYVVNATSLVKLCRTAAHKKLFFRLRRLRQELDVLGEGDPPPEIVAKIAERLGVPAERVVEMNRRLFRSDLSLNSPTTPDGNEELLDRLVDRGADEETKLAKRQELAQRRARLQSAFETLSDRERWILKGRRLQEEPIRLEELAAQYGISRERVRQIEATAIEKLQHFLGVVRGRGLPEPEPGPASWPFR